MCPVRVFSIREGVGGLYIYQGRGKESHFVEIMSELRYSGWMGRCNSTKGQKKQFKKEE